MLTAQSAAPKDEAQLDKQVAQLLVGYARSAESYKMPSVARRVYEQILDHYDVDHPTARAGLGWKKVKGEWQQVAAPATLPADAATAAQKKVVADAWHVTRKRAGALHRELGLALLAAEERPRGSHQLERALAFVPDDQAAHRALGHEEFEGFFGTAEQIAFVQRMRAILATAREIATKEIAVETVDSDRLPNELRRTGIAFAGARTKYVTYWVAGSPEEAAQNAIANERAAELLQFLLGDSPEVRKYLIVRPVTWVAVLRSAEQRARLLDVSPEARAGESPDRILLYGGKSFTAASGKAEWVYQRPESDADHATGQYTKRSTPWFNAGLSEGLVHTMTWLLCGTTKSSYMELPTTVGAKEKRSTDPMQWLQVLRDGVEAGTDWPLVQVPRERLENFRAPVRYKAWSFVSWLLARHPEQWALLMITLGHEPRLPEDVTRMFTEVLGRDLGEVEAEWREWVRRDSPIGKASGLPQ